jgi:uncharacterized surface anchored protein
MSDGDLFVTREELHDRIQSLEYADIELGRRITETERVLRVETKEQIAIALNAVHEMRKDLKGDINEVKIELQDQRTLFQKMLTGQNKWAVTIITGVVVMVVGYFLLVHFGIVHSK